MAESDVFTLYTFNILGSGTQFSFGKHQKLSFSYQNQGFSSCLIQYFCNKLFDASVKSPSEQLEHSCQLVNANGTKDQ